MTTEHVNLKGASRFCKGEQLADTLQGRIYKAMDLVTRKPVVIKEARRDLVLSGKSKKGTRVAEDFMEEREMTMRLTNLPNCPEGIIHGIDQWDDENCHYYAMEYCPVELFDFIKNIHESSEYIKFKEAEANKQQVPMETPNEYVKQSAKIFKDICIAVQYLHSNNYCHLDLSLENIMIYDVEKLKVKIIDFGVMRQFDGKDFKCKGRIGKIFYMCPEAYQGDQIYDAKAADVYSLGIILFFMLFGGKPYKAPIGTAFEYFMCGRIEEVLMHWKVLRLVTEDALDLLKNIIRYENKRITLDEILQHSFFETIDNEQNNKESTLSNDRCIAGSNNHINHPNDEIETTNDDNYKKDGGNNDNDDNKVDTYIIHQNSDAKSPIKLQFIELIETDIGSITLNASKSIIGNSCKYFMADFGDGTPTVEEMSSSSISHAYSKPGKYEISVTVKDNDGQINTTSIMYKVNKSLPIQKMASNLPLSVAKDFQREY